MANNNGVTVSTDQNGNAIRRTTSAVGNNAVRRQARVGSQLQSMWSNPQVRMNRQATSNVSSWTSDWNTVSNNSHREISIPMNNSLNYRVQA